MRITKFLYDIELIILEFESDVRLEIKKGSKVTDKDFITAEKNIACKLPESYKSSLRFLGAGCFFDVDFIPPQHLLPDKDKKMGDFIPFAKTRHDKIFAFSISTQLNEPLIISYTLIPDPTLSDYFDIEANSFETWLKNYFKRLENSATCIRKRRRNWRFW